MIEYDFHKHEQHENVLVLELIGRLDAASSEFLLDTLQGLIEDGNSNFVLNCDELDHISSLGLGALVRAKRRLNADGAIALANVHGTIAEVLRIVHFDRLFHMFESVDDAAASMN